MVYLDIREITYLGKLIEAAVEQFYDNAADYVGLNTVISNRLPMSELQLKMLNELLDAEAAVGEVTVEWITIRDKLS